MILVGGCDHDSKKKVIHMPQQNINNKKENLDIKKVFDAHTTSKNYTSIIVPNALHGFDGMEQKLAKLVGEWYYRLL